MSSETITRNDLKAILDSVLPELPLTNNTVRFSATSSNAISSTDIDNRTQGATITLPAGTYYILGQWQFNTRTTTGTTNSQTSIVNVDTNTIIAANRMYASGYNFNVLQASATVTITEPTTFAVTGGTNRAYTGSLENYIQALRINNLVGAGDIADHVVEEVTYNNWSYRKWDSGKLEQWYSGGPGAYTCSTIRGSMYSGGWLTYTYPVEFVDTLPVVSVSATLSTDAYVIMAQAGYASLTGVKIRIVSGSSISSNSNYNITLYACGRWK